jgi:hypothetical protein
VCTRCWGKQGLHIPVTDLFGVRGRVLLAKAPLDGAYRARVDSLCRVIEVFDFEIDTFGRLVAGHLVRHPLFARMPAVAPLRWKPFWTLVTRCGPDDGVRWLTIPGGDTEPYRVRVFSGDEERMWQLDELLDQPWLERVPPATEDGGNERAVLHIPDSGLVGDHDHRTTEVMASADHAARPDRRLTGRPGLALGPDSTLAARREVAGFAPSGQSAGASSPTTGGSRRPRRPGSQRSLLPGPDRRLAALLVLTRRGDRIRELAASWAGRARVVQSGLGAYRASSSSEASHSRVAASGSRAWAATPEPGVPGFGRASLQSSK